MRRRGAVYSYHFVALIKYNSFAKCRIHRSGCNQDHEPGFKSTQVACESRGKKSREVNPKNERKEDPLSPKNHRLNRSHCSEQELKRPIRCEHRPKSCGFLSKVWNQLAKPLLECLAFHNNSLPYTLMNYLSLIAILGIRIGSVLWRSVRCDEHDHL